MPEFEHFSPICLIFLLKADIILSIAPEEFFTALDIETVVSRPTNKEILQLGAETSIDESCLSAKIYLGHVSSLIGTCDYIRVPRISKLWEACKYTEIKSMELYCSAHFHVVRTQW